MSLLNKVNFTKGWPSKSVVEAVLMPDTDVELEAGFVGRRKHTSPDVWVLGITSLTQEAFIFRNDFDDPDAARASTNGNSYVQVPIGGIQGIAFQNPLEIETTQFAGTPAVGQHLYADTDGKLKVGADAAGEMVVASKVIIAVCIKAATVIGNSTYITVIPVPTRYVTAAS